jgi:Caspase domain
MSRLTRLVPQRRRRRLAQKKYIMDVHGFEEDNIVVLLDDGQHPDPTMENMLQAYRDVVSKAEKGDSIFLHYSGHGSKIKDDDGDDDDGYDEVLVPLDYNENGMIRDDDLYDIIVKGLPKGVHVVSLVSIYFIDAGSQLNGENHPAIPAMVSLFISHH